MQNVDLWPLTKSKRLIVNKYHSFDEIDKAEFSKLIESGFNKKLTSDYFEITGPNLICLAIQNGNYLGAIVVEGVTGTSVNYLDKIVVAKEHQGGGIGSILWEELNGHSHKTIWRAKKDNPIIDFYMEKCNGHTSFGDVKDYVFFYYGLDSGELDESLKFAIAKKPTLEMI
jgi:acetylglutamate synthase